MIIYKDRRQPYIEIFNPKTGTLIRTNLLDKSGQETRTSPSCRYLPELIDIGIMGHCSNKTSCEKFGVKCYQGNQNEENMSFEKYKEIIDQVKGYTFQVALGGRGDPNKHEDFYQIVKYTREKGIVPNLTTSGHNITNEEIEMIINYCGAVAISFYSKLGSNGQESNPETIEVINLFKSKMPTNIHYVINNKTIDEAILRLKGNYFPSGINGVIFLLYKVVGNAINDHESALIPDEKMKTFLDCVFKIQHPFKIGFDTCFFSHLVLYDDSLKNNPSVQACESGKFSCYVSCKSRLFSCSFLQDCTDGIELTSDNFLESWNQLISDEIIECPCLKR